MITWLKNLLCRLTTSEQGYFSLNVSDPRYIRVFKILYDDGHISSKHLGQLCGRDSVACINALRDNGLCIECRQKPVDRKGPGSHRFCGSTVEYHLIKK